MKQAVNRGCVAKAVNQWWFKERTNVGISTHIFKGSPVFAYPHSPKDKISPWTKG